MAGQSDGFNFEIGKWTVRHRYLNERLADSHNWLDFEGTSQTWATMGGHANVEDNHIDRPGGAYRAMAIRAYDPGTETWAIWWIDGRNPHHLDPPVKGRFHNGVGTFVCDDTFNGKPIKVRFIWSKITPNAAHWEQAFSPDGGKTWETNWEMHFTRVE